MRALFILKSFFVLLILFTQKNANSQTTNYILPVTVHVLDNWPNTTDQDIMDMFCKVNRIYKGTDPDLQLAVSQGIFPSNYLQYINDSRIRFQLIGVKRYENLPLGGQSTCGINLKNYPRVDGINIYLYNYAGSGNGQWTAFNPCNNQLNKDIIFIKQSGFDKEVVSHELGHYLDLPHLSGIPQPVMQSCGNNSANCCPTTENPNISVTSCSMSDGVNQPQNIMQDQNSGCRVFFTPCQTSRMRGCITSWRPFLPLPTVSAGTLGVTVGAFANNFSSGMPVFIGSDLGSAYRFEVLTNDCISGSSISWELYKYCQSGDQWSQSGTYGGGGSFNFNIDPYCKYYIIITDYNNGYYNTYKKEIYGQLYDPNICSCSSNPPDGKSNYTGVNSQNISKEIGIYPNPADDILFIKNHKVINNYTLKNIAGQTLVVSKLDKESIEINTLPSGTYFIIFSLDNGMQKTFKFSK